MFGTSGIRGPVGQQVTGELALSVGRALGVDSQRVVVGRDPRESGRFLMDALAAGLCESGTDVVDLELAATPTVARAVAWYDADTGVSVTASHNPPEDNGIKLWQESGQAFDEARREEVAGRVREADVELAAWDEVGTRTRENATDRHVDALVAATDVGNDETESSSETENDNGNANGGGTGPITDPDGDPLAVALDLGNGAGSVTIEALSGLGCVVETLNAQPDGGFPARPSEPNERTLESLRAFVAGTDAALGLAHDGDADRLVAVDGNGEFVPKDALLALFAADTAAAGEQVACPVDTSLVVEDYLRERGIDVTYTPVGDVYVADAVGGNVTFGGEPSGAWIWPAQTLCPDGPLAACRLAALCADRSLADRVNEVPAYPIERANVEVGNKGAVMGRVRERAGEEGEVTTLDGARVDTEKGWFLVRASGTQPLIRLTAEARSADRAESLLRSARDLVETARD